MQSIEELAPAQGRPVCSAVGAAVGTVGCGTGHASSMWGMDMAMALRTLPCAQFSVCVRACIVAAGAGHADHR